MNSWDEYPPSTSGLGRNDQTLLGTHKGPAANLLKKVRRLVLFAFSGARILPFPFHLPSGLSVTRLLSGIGFSARGTKVGLMSSMGSRVTGHASPCAICFANEGSISLIQNRSAGGEHVADDIVLPSHMGLSLFVPNFAIRDRSQVHQLLL